ncbi:MAG: LON peptidase substrate-binding domain-containing protein [Rhodothermales bacterium]|nr:LON peptidase substrate-binding domain-containing protein [Rhodothermales bacterium]
MESDSPLIPLFPLSLVLFPEESLPLHIFEPRYKAMVADVLEADSEFGVVLSHEGNIASVGCSARITKRLSESDNGEMDIIVVGDARFQLNDLVDGRAYMQCHPTWLDEDSSERDTLMIERVITQHMRLLELAGRTVRPSLYQDVEYVSYVIARNAGLDLAQKQLVLEMLSENDRISYLVDHMEKFIPEVEQIESVRKKVQSNGHFQDFPPE